MSAGDYSLDLSLREEEGSFIVRRASDGEGLAIIHADLKTLRDPAFWMAVKELVVRAHDMLHAAAPAEVKPRRMKG